MQDLVLSDVKVNMRPVKSLLQSVGKLSSFSEVRAWDSKAELVAKSLERHIAGCGGAIRQAEKEQAILRVRRKSLPFFKRLISKRAPIRNIQRSIDASRSYVADLENLCEELRSWIKRTPDDATEARKMLKELRFIRKVQRLTVRIEKDTALKPHRNDKELIESQILELDRYINWISRIQS